MSKIFNESFIKIPNGATEDEVIRIASLVKPTKRQLAWHEIEYYGFIHFGVNTFTERGWGTGKEDPKIFKPSSLDPRQWARVASEGGMKMLIITAKHHDGFCLWPSKFTDHTIANADDAIKHRDIVGELSEACKEYNIKLGIYLSPWDMNNKKYGTDEYNDFFINQLTELLTNYGELGALWFDGACGGGPNGKKQEYDWERYMTKIRELQPNAVTCICGADVRWVGTEEGYARYTEWCTLPSEHSSVEKIAKDSQREDMKHVFKPGGSLKEQNLGAIEHLKESVGLIWYPAEVDMSIRPGWFYVKNEDKDVKTPEMLMGHYFASVGRNAGLLLNLPPDKRGLVHEIDAKSVKGFKEIRDEAFACGLIKENAKVNTDLNQEKVYDGEYNTYAEFVKGQIECTFNFDNPIEANCIEIMEYINNGQQIEKFEVYTETKEGKQELASATTVGYKRLLTFSKTKLSNITVKITKTRGDVSLRKVEIYNIDEKNLKYVD